MVAVGAIVPPVGRAAGPCTGDWPMFQHDQGRTGSTACTDLTSLRAPALAPRWFFQTPGDVTAEPAVVAGRAYVGDGSGLMHAIDVTSGQQVWSFDITHNDAHVDHHTASYGLITSSAAVADVPSMGSTVFFGGGGTVYALDAATGAPRWATDVDPANPTSSAEVESSPVVWTRTGGNSVVFVGMDTNEDKGTADGGVLALNARTGALLWKYDADKDRVVNDLVTGSHDSTGCGDIWSSPALDSARALLFFGGGNCNLAAGGDQQRLIAVNADGGDKVWDFVEPAANHRHDMDFGASPVLTNVDGEDVVVQAGKSGWVYVVDRATGHLVRGVQTAEGSAIGGFIGSVSVAVDPSDGHPVLYGDSAIPAPTDGFVDTSLAGDPTRMSSLHAVDLVTGAVLWHRPTQTPSYAPTTVAGGVVFAPDTTEFSLNAYDATTGLPLWHLPVAAATSGGVAVAGDTLVVGAGTYFDQASQMPPQATGVWCFQPAA